MNLELRKVLLDYIGAVFTGYDRVMAHRRLGIFLRTTIEDQVGKNQYMPIETQTFLIKMLISIRITNDVFSTLNYPTDSKGAALIPLPLKYRKKVMDKADELIEGIKNDVIAVWGDEDALYELLDKTIDDYGC